MQCFCVNINSKETIDFIEIKPRTIVRVVTDTPEDIGDNEYPLRIRVSGVRNYPGNVQNVLLEVHEPGYRDFEITCPVYPSKILEFSLIDAHDNPVVLPEPLHCIFTITEQR